MKGGISIQQKVYLKVISKVFEMVKTDATIDIDEETLEKMRGMWTKKVCASYACVDPDVVFSSRHDNANYLNNKDLANYYLSELNQSEVGASRKRVQQNNNNNKMVNNSNYGKGYSSATNQAQMALYNAVSSNVSQFEGGKKKVMNIPKKFLKEDDNNIDNLKGKNFFDLNKKYNVDGNNQGSEEQSVSSDVSRDDVVEESSASSTSEDDEEDEETSSVSDEHNNKPKKKSDKLAKNKESIDDYTVPQDDNAMFEDEFMEDFRGLNLDMKDLQMEENAEEVEEEPLNSNDDIEEEEPKDANETENIVICQYEKVLRSKNKWKFELKTGIANIHGVDFVFSKSNGEAEF